MGADLPDYYFRARDTGAVVFRVDTENRQRRIDLEEIAVVNIRNGTIRPHGEVVLSEADLKAIQDWMAERAAVLEARDLDDVLRAVDTLNATTQWVLSRASEAQLEQVTDTLLLAMHDLRTALVRRQSERMLKAEEGA